LSDTGRQLDYAFEAKGDQHKASGCPPAPIETTASTVIHPIVSHSSPNASRMSCSRSDCGGKKSGGGAQESAMRERYSNQVSLSALGLGRVKTDIF